MAGPAQQYVVTYNGYQLPGYAQEEDDDSTESISTHYGPYWDGGISDYMGLSNKDMRLKFKIWDPSGTYQGVKDEYMKATAVLRSNRSGWSKLYVDYTDKYYLAKVKSIRRSKVAGTSVRTLDYDVEFETLPWLESNYQHYMSIDGAGTIDTDYVSRTIASGAWSPISVAISGTDVTVSGYTETGEFAGFISVSGSCTALVVDTEAFTAWEGGNANAKMAWKNYGMWVGPGKTTFVVGGSPSAVSFVWRDRWY